MYADQITDSMKAAISETQRRRKIQLRVQREHDIDPQTIRRRVSDILLSLGGRSEARAHAEEGAPAQRPTHPEMPTRRARAADPDASRRRCTRRRRISGSSTRRACATRCVDLRKELKALRSAGVVALSRDSVRAPSAWLGPGRLVQDAQVVCDGGAHHVRGTRDTPIGDGRRGARRRRVPDAGGGRPPRPHRALGSRRGAAAGRDGGPRPRVAGRSDLPARRRLGDADLQRSARSARSGRC